MARKCILRSGTYPIELIEVLVFLTERNVILCTLCIV